MKIKFCGIKNLSEAEYCISIGVDFIGINFVQDSHRFCKNGDILQNFNKLQKFNDIDKKNSLFVAVFYKNTLEQIDDILQIYNFDILQFSSDYEPDELNKYRYKYEVWKVVNQNNYNIYNNYCDKLLFDVSHGAGIEANFTIPANIDKKYGIAGGINEFNISTMFANYPRADFFDLASGIEQDKFFCKQKALNIVNTVKFL